MKKRLYFVFALVVAMTMVFAACTNTGGEVAPEPSPADTAPAPADTAPAPPVDDTVYTINMQFNYAEPMFTGMQHFFDEIESKSDGRIKIDKYYSFSLVALPDLVRGLQSGQVDMAAFAPHEFPSLLPLNGTMWGLPFLGWEDQTAVSKIYNEVYNEYPEMQAEFEELGLRWLAGYSMPGNNAYTIQPGLTTPTDTRNRKIMIAEPEMQKLVAANGGAPSQLPPMEWAQSLERGVVDTVFTHINASTSFGVMDMTKQAVFFGGKESGDSGGWYFPTVFVTTDDFLNTLPEDLRAIVVEVSSKYGEYMLENELNMATLNYENMQSQGIEVVTLTPDQIAAYADAMTDYRTENLKNISEFSPHVYTIYDAILEKIASY